MAEAKILVVDDEPKVLDLIASSLEKGGYEILRASDATSALKVAEESNPDLIVLDLILPDLNGLEVIRRLRASTKSSEVAIIVVSGEGETTDRIAGLEGGADDYIAKPFSPRELQARISAVLRRKQPAKVNGGVESVVGKLRVDPVRCVCEFDGKAVPLTTTEFKIVHLLSAQPGKVFSRDEILSLLHGGEAAAFARTIDAHVKSIRKKLAEGADLIQTVRGFGYRVQEA